MSAVRRPFAKERVDTSATFVVLLFAFAFGVRLYVANSLAGEPVWDGHYYDFGARHIASGFGYADEVVRDGHSVWHPWCHYPVGYSGFLAAFYKLFGASHRIAHVANALVGGLLPVVTFLLAGHALSPMRAKVAGILVAVHPGLILYSAVVMSEPLSALLVLLAFYVTLHLRPAQRPLRCLTAGAVILGIAALVRPQALLCVPFLALAVPRGRLSSRIVGAIVACVVAVMTVLPWTARNCRVMDGCALVSTNAGWNLAIGSFPRATGRFETLRSSDGCREVTGQVQQDRCWLAYGVTNIKRAPRRWLALVPAKLSYTFDHESFAVEYLHEARPSAWPDARRSAMRALLTAFHRGLLAIAVLGCVAFVLPWDRTASRSARIVQSTALLCVAIGAAFLFTADSPRFWPLAIVACVVPWLPLPGRPAASPAILMSVSLLATTALAHALFFGEDRYHVVATPILCLLAAAALRPAAPPARPFWLR